MQASKKKDTRNPDVRRDFCFESRRFPAAIRLGPRDSEASQRCRAAVAEVPGARRSFQELHVLLIPQLSAMGF